MMLTSPNMRFLSMNFHNQCIVVTGGASGIGEACCRLLASRGGNVVVADKNVDKARALASEIGGRAEYLDVGDDECVSRLALSIDELTPINGLINCAGILQRPLPPGNLTMKEWDLVLRIDLRGTYLCCVAFGELMAKRHSGSIVNIASVSGMRSGPLHGYGPAKAGVIHLSECLAAEWGPRGVRVNTVSPGFTETPALNKGINTGVLQSNAMSTNSALGRLVQPEEVAAAAAFMTSEFASGITGVNLPVDVGYLVATPWANYGGLRHP